jgi:hypothetical protein
MLRARAVALFAAALIGCAAEAAPRTEEQPSPPVTPTTKAPVANGPETQPQNAFTGTSAACGDLFAYRASDDGTQIFGVTFAHAHARARDGEVIDLGASPEDVLVTVDVFAQAATTLACHVLAGPQGEKTTWVAEAGRVETLVGDREVAFMLEDVHLVGPEKGFAVVVPRVFIGAHR